MRAATLLMTAAILFVVWFIVTIYPRVSDPEPLAELTQPIPFASGLDAEKIGSTLSALAKAFLMREDNAGIAIGVVVGGQRHTVVSGIASKTGVLRAVDENSLFEIGSVTKVFTGIALAQSVRRGEITLEQPIEALLPTAYASPQLTARHITVGDLATHHAGLQRTPSAIPAWSEMFPGNPWSELTEADMVASLNKALEDPPVSDGYSYSGFGYMLLGRVLERATGKSYAQLIEQGIAAPLRMTDTQVVLAGNARRRLVDGHRNGRTLEHHLDHTFPAAGGIAASVKDLLTLVEANLRPDGTAIGDALLFAATDLRPASGETRIALGWHVDPGPDGTRLIFHHGAMLGFWTYVGFSPQAGVGVAVLANSRDPSVSALGVELLRGLAQARRVRRTAQ